MGLAASRSHARLLERQERTRPIFASAAHFLVGCDSNIAAAYERDWPVAPERRHERSKCRRHEFDEIIAMLNKSEHDTRHLQRELGATIGLMLRRKHSCIRTAVFAKLAR